MNGFNAEFIGRTRTTTHAYTLDETGIPPWAKSPETERNFLNHSTMLEVCEDNRHLSTSQASLKILKFFVVNKLSFF
jgi:hypothetical protein